MYIHIRSDALNSVPKNMLPVVITSNEVISNIHEVEAFGTVLVDMQKC